MKTIVSKIKDRRSFVKGRDTMEVGYPWLTFGCIMALEYLINRDMKVLEFGSGGSTVFFANNCSEVKSYETDPKWYEVVRSKLAEYGHVTLCLDTELGNLDSLTRELDNYYDIILVDSGWVFDSAGVKHSPQRGLIAKNCISKLKVGGYLIIDNYLHYGLKGLNLLGFDVFTFDDFNYSGRGTKICKKL